MGKRWGFYGLGGGYTPTLRIKEQKDSSDKDIPDCTPESPSTSNDVATLQVNAEAKLAQQLAHEEIFGDIPPREEPLEDMTSHEEILRRELARMDERPGVGPSRRHTNPVDDDEDKEPMDTDSKCDDNPIPRGRNVDDDNDDSSRNPAHPLADATKEDNSDDSSDSSSSSDSDDNNDANRDANPSHPQDESEDSPKADGTDNQDEDEPRRV
ncbi:dentin sialophosphoprotein-like [Ipomoea triloba]|uniref:dentin sialophosphoprotein-like n=1 Tax=Ipomoea triloba TaxID=35885 RepID=UPI00125E9C83|nr:dentin sialophosphoprotein-like [Ipomoea triloba]